MTIQTNDLEDRLRLIQQGICPECEGAGCSGCSETGCSGVGPYEYNDEEE